MSDFSPVAPPSNFTQSSAYAAAVQKAKQIAAKINPVRSPPDSGVKRELEDGFQPEAKKVAGPDQNSSGGGAALAQGPQSGNRSTPGMGPDSHVFTEEIMVPDKIVGLIIGRGGEQITRLQAESGCKIQMERSRGTSERQCCLTGSKEAIARAKDMVMNIVNTLSRSEGFGGNGPPGVQESEQPSNFQPSPLMNQNNSGPPGQICKTEIMVPGQKVGLIIGKGGETIKQLQEQSGAKMVVVQDSNNQDFEKPLMITGTQQQVDHAKDLVYQLIADKEMQGGDRRGRGGDRGDRGHFGGGGGPGGGGYNNNYNNDFDNGNNTVVEILVPRAAVGVVIGKGGDMIKKIQNETGARLQFEQGRDDGPGDRKCILTGKPDQTEEARQRVEQLIDSVQRRDNDSGRDRGGGPGGRGGRDRDRGDRRGGEGYGERPGGRGDRWGGGGRDRGDKSEITFAVPANRAGFVIGRGGETIKQINHQTGAHCEIDRKLSAVNPQEKVFVIQGTPEQIEEAKRQIIEKSGVDEYYGSNSSHNNAQQNSMPITSTAYPNQGGFQAQGWGGANSNSYQWGGVVQSQGGPGPGGSDQSNPSQVQINPVSGQPDYTLQWAEYYKNLGLTREAELIEQQAKKNLQPQMQPGAGNVGQAQGQAQQAGGAQAAAAAGVQQGQADYSAQWAEYYRSIGKIKEAEAIEMQMKAKAAAVAGGGPNPTQPSAAPVGVPQTQQPQQPAFNQYGGYQPNPGGYYGGPGQQQPYGNFGGYGGYGQAGSEN